MRAALRAQRPVHSAAESLPRDRGMIAMCAEAQLLLQGAAVQGREAFQRASPSSGSMVKAVRVHGLRWPPDGVVMSRMVAGRVCQAAGCHWQHSRFCRRDGMQAMIVHRVCIHHHGWCVSLLFS